MALSEEFLNSKEFHLISETYGNQKAKRSGVPLMNHIIEGCEILQSRGQNLETQKAFCLHPIFQCAEYIDIAIRHKNNSSDKDRPISLAELYAYCANRYLPHHQMPAEGIRIIPVSQVNEMLIADKLQNKKDFELYHKGKHPNSDRLAEYFNEWLTALLPDYNIDSKS